MADKRTNRGAQKERPDVTIKECQAEVRVSPEVLNRALGLLARWAVRHRRKVLEDAGIDLESRVTGYGIKGYGGKNGSN